MASNSPWHHQQYPPFSLYSSIVVTIMCPYTYQIISLPFSTAQPILISVLPKFRHKLICQLRVLWKWVQTFPNTFGLSMSLAWVMTAKLQTQMSFEEALVHCEHFIQAWNLMRWSLLGRGFFLLKPWWKLFTWSLGKTPRFQAVMLLYCSSLTWNTTTEAADCLETPGARAGAPGIVSWLVC